MYNLHSHSILSDGVLLPSEVAMRYLSAGYKVIAITEHVDYSNIQPTIKAILGFTRYWPKDFPIQVLPGVELTHLPLEQFKPLAKYARRAGIKVIVAHGETTMEPVAKGTNRAALESDIDILAHPGLISDDDVKFAGQRGIFLEITGRKGHNQSNAHVAKQGLKFAANLILGIDSHSPDDIIKPQELKNIAQAAGLSENDILKINDKVTDFLKRKGVLCV
jgi:histidinol phosphatase-like PHP family hydrolase